jgi:hypothetical protein
MQFAIVTQCFDLRPETKFLVPNWGIKSALLYVVKVDIGLDKVDKVRL